MTPEVHPMENTNVLTDADLLTRLRKVESSGSWSQGVTTNWYRNPDGPEAADRIEALSRTTITDKEVVSVLEEQVAQLLMGYPPEQADKPPVEQARYIVELCLSHLSRDTDRG